jgi:hypothetical protein
LQSGLSVYIRRHEVVESDLTEEPPPPPPKQEGWAIRLAKRVRRKEGTEPS